MNHSSHIVLLGDSIFDNKAYTQGEPDVVAHLQRLLPQEWQATLLAVDGSSTGSMSAQLSRVPLNATHLVLSLGGNDAILNIDLLDTPLDSSRAALLLFAERLKHFDAAYRRILEALAARNLDLTVCTIYNGAFDADMEPLVKVALMMFNDVIARAALDHAARLVELRSVCDDRADYANPIEPSGTGGRKIALAIARAVDARPGKPALQVTAGVQEE